MAKSYKRNLAVAVMNDKSDLKMLLEKNIYRIPVASYNKYLKDKWVPEFISFYQTRLFKEEGFRINYKASVAGYKEVTRQELFPDEKPDAPKYNKRYYLFSVEDIKRIPNPIISKRRRRINFIISNSSVFDDASEINDLYLGNRIENKLWRAFKKDEISAEREEYVRARGKYYSVDFSIYCKKGKIAVETDGDFWHSNPPKAKEDNVRDNNLKSIGWQVLRFSESQIVNDLNTECMPIVKETISYYGGIAV
ncbi:MAG: endonuclease domain-containing protein [Ignavibacteriaceae bacterium]